MKTTKYTPEQKKEYFARLREDWKKSKELSETSKYQAIIRECEAHGVNFSATGIVFTAMQMDKLGLEGLPHVDCKTFNNWKESGFKVKKGEKSKIKGITWLSSKTKDGEEDDGFVYPKVYHLFHRTQVEPIK